MPIVTTRPRLRLAAGLLAATLVASLAAFVGTAAPATATPDHYTPKEGVRFNNPLAGEQSRRNIIRHLIRTINSVPKKEHIRIASWNVRSDAIVDALIRAHNRRKVSVRVVMDRLNANRDNPNFGVNRLEKALKVGNGKRKKSLKSFVRKCVSACRAPRGIAHTKFYLFSKAGSARNIVMFGSANATDLAASAQWNDIYTVRRNQTMYGQFEAVFQEMAHDKNLPQPYLGYATADNKITTWFYPYKGVGTEQDPVLAELAKTRCQGSTINGGKTRIRIAMTSMHGERGILIAQRLMRMWNRGCDIKIVYAVFGNEVMSVFRNKGPRPMPFRQIAQDFTRDGVYDRYLHLKDMTISGHYDGATDAKVVFNGTANWTSVALASDEAVAKIYGGKLLRKYSRWIDWLYAHPPKFSNLPPGTTPGIGVMGRAAVMALQGIPFDPYAKMRADGVDVPPLSDLPSLGAPTSSYPLSS